MRFENRQVSGATLAFGLGRHPAGSTIEGESNIVRAAHRDMPPWKAKKHWREVSDA
jgi:hypothetical protein